MVNKSLIVWSYLKFFSSRSCILEPLYNSNVDFPSFDAIHEALEGYKGGFLLLIKYSKEYKEDLEDSEYLDTVSFQSRSIPKRKKSRNRTRSRGRSIHKKIKNVQKKVNEIFGGYFYYKNKSFKKSDLTRVFYVKDNLHLIKFTGSENLIFEKTNNSSIFNKSNVNNFTQKISESVQEDNQTESTNIKPMDSLMKTDVNKDSLVEENKKENLDFNSSYNNKSKIQNNFDYNVKCLTINYENEVKKILTNSRKNLLFMKIELQKLLKL